MGVLSTHFRMASMMVNGVIGFYLESIECFVIKNNKKFPLLSFKLFPIEETYTVRFKFSVCVPVVN